MPVDPACGVGPGSGFGRLPNDARFDSCGGHFATHALECGLRRKGSDTNPVNGSAAAQLHALHTRLDPHQSQLGLDVVRFGRILESARLKIQPVGRRRLACIGLRFAWHRCGSTLALRQDLVEIELGFLDRAPPGLPGRVIGEASTASGELGGAGGSARRDGSWKGEERVKYHAAPTAQRAPISRPMNIPTRIPPLLRAGFLAVRARGL